VSLSLGYPVSLSLGYPVSLSLGFLARKLGAPETLST